MPAQATGGLSNNFPDKESPEARAHCDDSGNEQIEPAVACVGKGLVWHGQREPFDKGGDVDPIDDWLYHLQS